MVRGLRAAQRAWELALTPIVGIGAAGGVIMVSLVHGFSSVYAVFGRQDADRLFGIDTGRRIGGGWWLSLQLIPLTLVLSRTSIADSLFPVLPLFYFMARPPTRNARSLWPPSAAMMVACLPYVRGVYYEFYKRVVKKREQAWIKEVQPRAGEDGEGAGGENVADQGGNDVGGINFELGVELEIVEEQEVMPNAAPQAAPGENRPPADQLENFFRDRQALHNHHGHHHHGGGIVISVYQLANLITGALLFPSIATSMGGLLKLALPKSWTTPPSFWNRNARQGLLQSQFGRSVVGGCLFVVLKDSLLLYSKFRLAQDHRKRRVVDYDPQKGQRARATGR